MPNRDRCPRACARRRPQNTDLPACSFARFWMSSMNDARSCRHAGAAEETRSCRPCAYGAIRSTTLMPGLEGFDRRGRLVGRSRGRLAVDRKPFVDRRSRWDRLLVHRLADHVHDPAERHRSPTGIDDRRRPCRRTSMPAHQGRRSRTCPSRCRRSVCLTTWCCDTSITRLIRAIVRSPRSVVLERGEDLGQR